MRSLAALLVLSSVLACRPAARAVEPAATPAPAAPAPRALDRLLALAPAGSEIMLARDATVVLDYLEESVRFFDGPLAVLRRGPFAEQEQLRAAQLTFGKLAALDTLAAAFEGSGVRLADGLLLARRPSGTSYIIFAAADPGALVTIGEATGNGKLSGLRCRTIAGAAGFNVCADSQPQLDAYVPSGDSRPFRADLAEHLYGVSLDDANLLAHVSLDDEGETYMAVGTEPGRMYMAVSTPGSSTVADLRDSIEPGPASLLARVQPGAGFVWGRMNPAVFHDPKSSGGVDPLVEAALGSMTGELLVAGSAELGAIVLQLGTRDASRFEPLLDPLHDMIAESVATELPELAGVTWSLEKTTLSRGSRTARAIHLGIEPSALTELFVRGTGLHPDAWMLTADAALVIAVGPDRSHASELLGKGTATPGHAERLGLPPQLTAALDRKEVGFIVHVPLDFLHGPPLRDLVRSAFDVPGSPLPPEQLLALADVWAPFSSATMWISPRGTTPVVHVAVQGIGNRATEEGRLALDAAHAVAQGGDPAAIFGSLATAHARSPMALAYAIRAGSGGTKHLTASGLGALLATMVVLMGAQQAGSG